MTNDCIKVGFKANKDVVEHYYCETHKEIKVTDLFDGANIILKTSKNSLIQSPGLAIQRAMHWSLGHAYSVFDQLLVMGFLEPYEEDKRFNSQKWVASFKKGIIVERNNMGIYKVLFSKESDIEKIIKNYIKDNPDCQK